MSTLFQRMERLARGYPDRSAVLSDCELYRWRLERSSGLPGPTVLIIGVNPSTADAIEDDQTIRKDMGFGARLGWSRILKGNLCAWRATDVRELARAVDPIGDECDVHLAAMIAEADVVIGAWGPLTKLPKYLRRRHLEVARLVERAGKPIMCFGTAKDGQPRHTLMLAYETPLVEWRAA